MEPTTQPMPTVDLKSATDELRTNLAQNRFQEVIAAIDGLLTAHPENRDLLYLLAAAQRMLKQIPEALATLERLEANHPTYPRTYQERGHCYIFLRDATQAIHAFEKAVQLNPALPASWGSLQMLYRIVGRMEESQVAGQHAKKLAELPASVTNARSMLADGDVGQAEAIIRPYLAKNPDDVEALRILANIARENDFTSDAEALYGRILSLAPDYQAARYDYALTLVDLHKHKAAREEIRQLLIQEPNNQGAHVTHASILLALGEVDSAIAGYKSCIERMPSDPELCQSLGHALKTNGRHEESVDCYRKAARLRLGFGEPYWSLANLKTYRFTDDEIETMKNLEREPRRQSIDRYHLCFALGKALEDRSEYSESFSYYARGNALKKAEVRYRADMQEAAARRQREICTREFFEQRKGWGATSSAPILIVGLPRAGSTLLEQILASHSQVEGTMELANIPRLVGSLGGHERSSDTRYPGILTELTAQQCESFGKQYLHDTLDYRTGKPYFIDKMPNNFRNIALIQLMLPNAKIIDARRGPMDCSFSNFKQLYATGHQFAYSLSDIGRYYRTYTQMMEHWDDILPGRVLRVQHEEVLEDLESSVRRILDYCELPFESACVEFHKTRRRVHTASSEQVRRPINRDGVDQWKPYEPWLDELKLSLGIND